MEEEIKKESHKNLKLAIVLLLEVLIAVGLGIGFYRFWVNQKLSEIKTVELDREMLTVNSGANEAQNSFTNIAIFGLDARETDELMEGNRSDTVMVASINKKTGEVKLMSLFRDTLLFVDAEGGLTTKVTNAYSYGGPELAISTLNHNLDLNITDFITVNFLSLSKAIDELGGLTIDVQPEELPMLNTCITEQINITDIYSDGVFSAGEQLLNGTQATAWTRIRSTDLGDITRTKRQRIVIAGIIEKAKEAGPATLEKIIDDVFPNIATSMDKERLYELAKELTSYSLADTAGFPFTYEVLNNETKGSVLIPADLKGNVGRLHEFLYGTKSYIPSEEVERISDALRSETGVEAK